MGRFGLVANIVECFSEPAFIDGGLKMAGAEEVEPIDFSFHGLGGLEWRFVVVTLCGLLCYCLSGCGRCGCRGHCRRWLSRCGIGVAHLLHLLEVIEANVVEVAALILACVVPKADDHLVAFVQVIILDAVVHNGEQHAVGVAVCRLLKILENEVLLRPFTPLACA